MPQVTLPETLRLLPTRELLPSRQRCFRVEVGFLCINIPITQVLERNFALGHGARDETASRQHLEIVVEVTEAGFAGEGAWSERIHGALYARIAGQS